LIAERWASAEHVRRYIAKVRLRGGNRFRFDFAEIVPLPYSDVIFESRCISRRNFETDPRPRQNKETGGSDVAFNPFSQTRGSRFFSGKNPTQSPLKLCGVFFASEGVRT
jgi:hypothetical protein